MLKEEASSVDTWARVCDTCRASPSAVYCKSDGAYLCVTCDSRVHATSRHERVWVCESCERAPAAFLCKADAASLCVDCDTKVHAANPLARRHHRVPVLPLSGCIYAPSATNIGSRLGASATGGVDEGETDDGFDEEDEDEAASWLLLNPSNNNKENNNNNTTKGCSIGGEVVDEYLDLVEFDLGGDHSQLNDLEVNNPKLNDEHHTFHMSHHQYAVPTQDKHIHHHHTFHMPIDPFPNNNTTFSTGHNVSFSSIDVGIVPESTTSDISTSHVKPSKGTIELFSSTVLVQQMPTQLSPMDREARVMRYREKKKTRKFEKTIRYASRKAYAETRPRIKGRFAKRSPGIDEVEVNQMFSCSVMADSGYGIVPSF